MKDSDNFRRFITRLISIAVCAILLATNLYLLLRTREELAEYKDYATQMEIANNKLTFALEDANNKIEEDKEYMKQQEKINDSIISNDTDFCTADCFVRQVNDDGFKGTWNYWNKKTNPNLEYQFTPEIFCNDYEVQLQIISTKEINVEDISVSGGAKWSFEGNVLTVFVHQGESNTISIEEYGTIKVSLVSMD